MFLFSFSSFSAHFLSGIRWRSSAFIHTGINKSSSKMSIDINAIGAQKVKSVANGEVKELKSLWEDQNAAVIFFRRWGCMFCRLWAKELGEIAPILAKHNIKLVGVGVEEAGSKEFVDGKFFDGELYYVENISTYQALGFKRFNLVTILTSLLWKQSREAIAKGRSMGLGGDMKGDWVQTGGALMMEKGGKVLHHFTQTGPGEHMSNLDILKTFGLENEFKPEMANKKPEERGECNSIQQDAHQASQSLIAHLVMVVIATGLEVQARPCFEGGDIELCFTKLALNDDESFPDIREQYSYDYALPNEGHKYDVLLGKRELRDLTEEYHKNCTGCYEETDVVDREDHVTQYLSELLVNTDSEITSLQASDVEETVEESRGKEDGYFSFLTGEEKIFEVDGIWSVPAQTIVEEGELLNNA